jgi:glucan 1,3-beta-glucosidase
VSANSKLVGETYPLIMGSGSYFSDMNNPQAVVRVGNPGDSGGIQWSDMIVSAQAPTTGAILSE